MAWSLLNETEQQVARTNLGYSESVSKFYKTKLNLISTTPNVTQYITLTCSFSDLEQKSKQTWNNPGTNELEQYKYIELNSDEIVGATLFGLNNATIWDCHLNHYAAYWWSDLQDANNMDVYLSILGWDQDSWDGGNEDNVPESESKHWEELSVEEKEAAKQICYAEELWDGISIPEWEEEE